MKSKLRDKKTRQIDDKNRSALDETIKVKPGFSQKAKESLKRNAALREKGHKFITMQPRKELVEYVEQDFYDVDTGKRTRRLVNLESIRRGERVLVLINKYLSKGKSLIELMDILCKDTL